MYKSVSIYRCALWLHLGEVEFIRFMLIWLLGVKDEASDTSAAPICARVAIVRECDLGW